MSDDLSDLPLLSELLCWSFSVPSKDNAFSSVSWKNSDDDDTDYVESKKGRQGDKWEMWSIIKCEKDWNL